MDELAGKYEFTGRKRLTIPEALAVKEELEEIDKLLKQLEEARKNAQIAIIDLEELSRFVEEVRALKKKGDPNATPAELAAAAEKRAASREANVGTGLDELGIFIADLVRAVRAHAPAV